MADRIKNYQQEADQITTLKEIRTDLGVTPSSYTPDATVVTKDRVVTFAQAEEELVVLSDIEKGVKQQVTEVDIAQKDIANIKALLQGNLYDYQTDSTSAYTKSVPSGAMPYAGLEQIGGKTVVWNQLCELDASIASQHGVTFTINNGVITTSGTADADFWAQVGKFYQTDNASVGDKLLFKMTPTGTAETFYAMVAKPGWATVYDGVIFTKLEDTTQVIRLYIKSGTNMDGKQISFVGANLTKMFGSGNEPSTVAEFESMFPALFYPYSAPTLLSAGVTEVVSKDSNNATLQTIPIPAEIQALEGYGWSCPDHYNYIDYEAKKYVQEVGSRAYASGDESDSTVITDGTTTYYPLNPSIETDISEYLTDDNLINVESGGTLTFPNSNGDDYRLPVSSEEEYMIDLQSAL